MIIRVQMSKEVADYYKNYNLDEVVNTLLQEIDFMNLPQYSGSREVIKDVNVTNELFIKMYDTFGPRSKKVSISRLLEYGYNRDFLSEYDIDTIENKEPNKIASLLKKAYTYLLEAAKLDSKLKELAKITGGMYRAYDGNRNIGERDNNSNAE